MRTVVVGASSGLGRCIGVGLGRRGMRVALLARRTDLLAGAAEEAGAEAVAVTCDVTDESSVRAAVDEAASALGGIDGLVYCPAVGPLAHIEELDAGTWRRVFDTNVVGASIVTAAVLPHLTETSGTAAYLSSVSAAMTAPWPGLGAYAVSKAALDRLVDAWRAEHPQVGFTRITVGDCIGGEGLGVTQFANDWDSALASEFYASWEKRGLLAGAFIEVEELVSAVDNVLRAGAGACIAHVAVIPRSPQ